MSVVVRLLIALVLLPACLAVTQAGPVVGTTHGAVEGLLDSGVSSFRGIPYAAAPVGALRWRAPEPSRPWKRLKADRFGASCIQPVSKAQDAAFGGAGVQSEDCLTLNVWTPRARKGERLPVMVWVHGGAFMSGAGSLPAYDGSALAGMGAVVVTINYRLGSLGFFCHASLDEEAPGGPVNFGLLDQIAALRWVQANAEAFGGDASNITLFGESAGAQSVIALTASPMARGLFQKGIAQSPYGIPSHTRDEACAAGAKVASELGLPGDRASTRDLRAMPAARFAGLTKPGQSLAPSLVFGDRVLPAAILDQFENGEASSVPLIIGNNSNEASVAALFGIEPGFLLEKLGMAKIAVRLLFPGTKDDADLERQVVRDSVFSAYVKRIADLQAARAPAWRYFFSYLPERQRGREPGVSHGGEVVFVLGTLGRAPAYRDIRTDADERMARLVASYWLAFARTGRPDVAGATRWDASTPRRSNTLELGEEVVLRRDFHERRLNILIKVIKRLGGMLDRRRAAAASLP
jgi:para-nitrobenzyl esterase